MTTSPWANVPDIAEEKNSEEDEKYFHYEFSDDIDLKNFLRQREELIEDLNNQTKFIFALYPQEIYMISFKKNEDVITFDSNIPYGYFRVYHLLNGDKFTEFTYLTKDENSV